MSRAFVLLLAAAAPAAGQPPRFQFKAGDATAYRVEQTTTITETTVANGKPTTATTSVKLALGRTWAVTAVGADGSGTLALTITAFKQTITRPDPDGKPETLVKDSAVPADAADMAAYLNKPILSVNVDPRGRVFDIKPAGDNPAAAAVLAVELPFRVQFPDADAATWTREFSITLDPPAGTGEKHPAAQTFRRKQPGVFEVTTTLTDPPKAAADLQPLVPFLWAGEVSVTDGKYAGAKLRARKEIAGHAGEGSRFVYESEFSETPAGK